MATSPQLSDLLFPDLQAQQLRATRQAALAQMMVQQGDTPLDTTRSVNGWVTRISPFEGLAKLAQTKGGMDLWDQSDKAQIAIGRQRAAEMARLLQGDAPQGAPAGGSPFAAVPGQLGSGSMDTAGSLLNTNPQAGMPPAGAMSPAPRVPMAGAPAGGGSPYTMGNALRGAVLGAVGGDAATAAYWKQFEGTDFTRTLKQAGIDPASPRGQALMQEQILKQNNIPPTRLGEGAYYDPRTGVQGLPTAAPPGFINQRGADGQWQTAPVQGGVSALTQSHTASELGKADATPTVAFQGSTPIFSTKGQDVRRAQGLTQPGDANMVAIYQGEMQKAQGQLAAARTPEERNRAQTDIQALIREMQANQIPVSPQLAPGVDKGITLSQEELSTKGKSLMADNAQTNTVIARLQSIKTLAPKAIAGAESERRDYFNGLLSLAGLPGANNSKTASDLVDKNASQIVSALRMGQGGAGTDALQTLLSAANPNRHMTPEAISEAADQLIASQKMVQDKTRLLQPHYTGRDPVNYANKELAFDQNADPRIWQWRSITDPAQRKAFAAQVMKSDPEFPKKIEALEKLGALK